MLVDAIEGHRIWAPSYDAIPNPLLSLEMRTLAPLLGPVQGLRILDAASGTGRWTVWLTARKARVTGIDACREMLLHAPHPSSTALADLEAIPLCDDTFDIAVCSFALSYLRNLKPVFRELARVARRVIVSDLHPEAARRGWTRSFRANGERYELVHYEHTMENLDAAAASSGLALQARCEPEFGEPERAVLEAAGKSSAFHVPAVLISSWNKPSS